MSLVGPAPLYLQAQTKCLLTLATTHTILCQTKFIGCSKHSSYTTESTGMQGGR